MLSLFYGENGGTKVKPVTELGLGARLSCSLAALTT